VCDKDEYLLTPVRYIHQNPVRAKMVRKAEDYPYSGHRSYAKGQVTEVVDPRLVLEMLGGQRAYRKFIERGALFWIVACVPEKTAILGFPDGPSLPTFGKLCLVAIGAVGSFVSPLEERTAWTLTLELLNPLPCKPRCLSLLGHECLVLPKVLIQTFWLWERGRVNRIKV